MNDGFGPNEPDIRALHAEGGSLADNRTSNVTSGLSGYVDDEGLLRARRGFRATQPVKVYGIVHGPIGWIPPESRR
jgi:hypothetical protein